MAAVFSTNAWYIIISFLPAFIWLAFYLREDSRPEPKRLLFLVFVGGMISAVFSIVADPKSEWEKIVKETPSFANAKILFDTTKVASRAYDVLSLKSSMHPGSFPGHTYFIIDKEGILRYVFDDPSMAIRNDLLISELAKLGGE